MTHTIKIDCSKWENVAMYALISLGILAWSALTFGLIYGEYWWIMNYQISNNEHLVPYVMILGIFTIGNIINLYYVFRTIYNNQNVIQFECSSGDCK